MSDELHISWSQLRNHIECRQKAALLRAGKRNPVQDMRNYLHGMVVDRIMRDWLHDPHRRPGAMTDAVDEYIDSVVTEAKDTGDGIVKWRNASDRAEMRLFCVELLTALEPILRRHVLAHEFISGHRFKTPIAIPDLAGRRTRIWLRGEIDLLVHTPAGPVVWDLKGTRDDHYWRKVLGQLLFYDLAVLAELKVQTVKVGLIQPMCKQPVVEWVLKTEHRREMWAQVVRMCHDIWRQDFACKQGTDGCHWCEVRHACPRMQPESNPMLAAGLRAAAHAMKETR